MLSADERPLPHTLSAAEVATQFETDSASGLNDEQAAVRLTQFGPNQLAEEPPYPSWKRFLSQFNELVIWILIAAALISGFLGEWIDALAILAIVVLNGVLGFIQEERAEHALAALRGMSAPMARVLRSGRLQNLSADQLVPGDLLQLESGDKVPADSRLVTAFSLTVQEAALTGESTASSKDAHPELDAQTPLGDRNNMVYLGTVIAAGKATAIVVATGMETELGQIAGLLSRYETEPTPLQRRLAELGRVLIVVCLALVAVIFTLQMLRGGEFTEVFLLAVSLAVAAVPEGLPAVVTIALALGLQRMVKRNALVRKLPSVETLGSVTVICTDKTGTLTKNEMTVRELVSGGKHYAVSGVGYSPQGAFRLISDSPDEPLDIPTAALPTDLIHALTIGVRCNNAQLAFGQSGTEEPTVVGDPTEGALLVVARKAHIKDEPFRLVTEIPFDSQRKLMSVVTEEADGQRWMHSKGAPEVVLNTCDCELIGMEVVPLSERRREELAAISGAMAARAMRVLGVASREIAASHDGEYREERAVFAGFIGMIDPPREEAKQAILRCREAGIRPVMITGDHPSTAAAIAREIGLTLPTSNSSSSADSKTLTGQQLDELSDEELAAAVLRVSVYARVSAEHKMRVVQAWKRHNHIVAMTGDGVNDAPAVKAADIGIAMGIQGTDVTKEAADMVLTDDNFVSIVNAVEEGRGIFDNIQKFVHYLLSCNAGEVLLMLFATLAGWPAPLQAIQLLWINLVTDGFPALALAMEPPEHDIMQRQPRPPHEPVITWRRGSAMLVQGSLMASAAAFGFWFVYRGVDDQLAKAQTVAFCVTALSQLFFSVSCRSFRYTMPQLGLFTNRHLLLAIMVSGVLQLGAVTIPFVQHVFEVTPLDGASWLLVVALALTPVSIIEITKIIVNLVRPNPAQPMTEQLPATVA